jgi:hypothetical protein
MSGQNTRTGPSDVEEYNAIRVTSPKRMPGSIRLPTVIVFTVLSRVI